MKQKINAAGRVDFKKTGDGKPFSGTASLRRKTIPRARSQFRRTLWTKGVGGGNQKREKGGAKRKGRNRRNKKTRETGFFMAIYDTNSIMALSEYNGLCYCASVPPHSPRRGLHSARSPPLHFRTTMNDQEELKIRHALFVEEYLRDFNGTKAAIRAGFAESGARVAAHRLLTNANIKKVIDKRKAEILAEVSADQFRTMRELSRIAYSDVRQIYSETGELKQPGKWDDDVAASIASVETVRRSVPGEEDDNGDPVFETVNKVRSYDKLKALELIGKHLNMFVVQVNVSGDQVIYRSEKPDKPGNAGA